MKSLIKRIFVTVVCSFAVVFSANAQDRDSFDEFRKGIHTDFQSFRNKVLEDYDKYLDGVWKEYQAFRGAERNKLPKPKRPPIADPDNRLPEVEIPAPKEPDPSVESQDVPIQPAPAPAPAPVTPGQSQIPFYFFNFLVYAPKTGLEEDAANLENLKYGELWRLYENRKIADAALPTLRRIAAEYTLNDWLTLELIRSYAARVFPASGSRLRISLAHYLLCHFGFDIRIGEESSPEKPYPDPMLLIPTEQTVYARPGCTINGKTYYLFYDDPYTNNGDIPFLTFDLPQDGNGRALDLVIRKPLTIPYSPHKYHFRYGNMEISGEMNGALMPLLRNYPQIPFESYAVSRVDVRLRESVSAQISRQLGTLSQHQAVDKLLQFVQKAFEYATDPDLHGFEKPYFFEEMLFYPKCDCEDRAIFYSYLLWNVLKVENHIIGYPMHESVAVHLDVTMSGDGYTYEGRKYYISDPTYIGSVTGMCPPEFRSVRPEIDFFAR